MSADLPPLRLALWPSMFGERERVLIAGDGFECSTFRYPSGVDALRLRHDRGELVVLPFRGQQIWRARFDGRELAMRSMFDEPGRSSDYLRTYGAFFLHCGLTGIGAPGPDDSHPLHGELPNAAYDEAWLEFDTADGSLAVGGSYRHTVAFAADYRATARTVLRRGSALLDVSLQVQNLRRVPMTVLYLGHANFRPADGGELVYSAPYTAEAVQVRRSIPSHIEPPAGYAALLEALAAEPARHHRLVPGVAYDPEVVFRVQMRADAKGWAHALQRHPDGTADYAAHRPEQAPATVRWLCRTADQDALGLSMAATSGVEGRSAELRAGRGVALPAQGTWRIDQRLGLLNAAEAAERAACIERLMGRA